MIMAMDYNDGATSAYQAPRFYRGDEHAARLIKLGHFSENQIMKTGYHRYIDAHHARLLIWLTI
jgi:hypothetical protein